MKKTILLTMLAVCTSLILVNPAYSQGTAFTYQGRLVNNTLPANGNYDFTFALFNNSNTNTGQLGATLTDLNIGVTNGLFTLTLDFGPVFTGNPAWLAIEVRTNGAASFTALNPLQALTPAPYAIIASAAGNLINGLTILQNTDDAPNVIGGSSLNFVSSGVEGATIGGGGASNYSGFAYTNSVTGSFGTVSGGYNNTAGSSATVSGGGSNNASGPEATISGGYYNTAGGSAATIGGGYNNNASVQDTTISGGLENTASGLSATIGGGGYNIATGFGATIGGGYYNTSSSNETTVGGGLENTASGITATVGGGYDNIASGIGAFVGGGGYDGQTVTGNTASGDASVVAGGLGNKATNYYSTVSGGEDNFAGGNIATISGGNLNTANGNASTLSGGAANSASGAEATISGGGNNTAGGNQSTIGGGSHNTTSGVGAFIGGGGYDGTSISGNNASGDASVVAGGLGNQATNFYATVPGGANNIAGGRYSFASGDHAQALHQGAFVWADSQSAILSSTANNQFLARATGGFFFYTDTSGDGAQLDTSDTSWKALSDRNKKKDIVAEDCPAVLNKLAQVPISLWRYKWESETNTPHIGPMAQDFIAAFYPGRDDKGITTLEFDGVELAAIQGLNQKLEDRSSGLEKENAELKAQNDSLARQLNDLAAEVKAIEQKK